MSSHPAAGTLIPLELYSNEQWLLHHVLSKRAGAEQRSRTPASPEPAGADRALVKVEAGDLLFTVAELERMREALEAHRRRADLLPGEQRDVRRIVDRIDATMARRRANARG